MVSKVLVSLMSITRFGLKLSIELLECCFGYVNFPRNSSGLHVIGQRDVIRPYVKLPF
ncbi:hypothetical protein X975_25552, partial [Stegodyphus mimosarum]